MVSDVINSKVTLIFLVAYHFLFAMYFFSHLSTFIFFCIHFSFRAPVEGLCCKPKYRANFIHHFIFVPFLYFFYHSSCSKDQFTVLSLKFGTQDFTDPDLLKIRRTALVCRCGFAFMSVSNWYSTWNSVDVFIMRRATIGAKSVKKLLWGTT